MKPAGPGTPAPGTDLEQLYREGFPKVFAFALRMLGDPEAARDAAQETFTTALARIGSFRGESAPLTWLLAITKRHCLRKQRGLRERSFGDLESIIEQHAEEPSPDHAAAERQHYIQQVKEGCLAGLLRCLPPSQRCVFVLHLLNDLSIREVSRIMGKSENSVRILLSRARSSMRAFLCRNCAFLDGTRCSCANMIEFSLRRGLIERGRPGLDLQQTREELRRFSDEVALYKSLPGHEDAIAQLMADPRFKVFSGKVK